MKTAAAGIALLLLTAASATSTAATVSDEDLLDCSRVENDVARLSCFDGLAARVRPAPPAAPDVGEPEPMLEAVAESVPRAVAEPAPKAVAEEASVVLTEDVGKTSVREDKPKKERPSWQANLTECPMGADGRLLFYFDNGQIWRQAKTRRHPVEDCLASAELTRDMFGFKMNVEGYGRTIRVQRIK